MVITVTEMSRKENLRMGDWPVTKQDHGFSDTLHRLEAYDLKPGMVDDTGVDVLIINIRTIFWCTDIEWCRTRMLALYRGGKNIRIWNVTEQAYEYPFKHDDRIDIHMELAQ